MPFFIAIFGSLVIGGFAGYSLSQRKKRIFRTQKTPEQILAEATVEARSFVAEAKKRKNEIMHMAHEENVKFEEHLTKLEALLKTKEEFLAKKQLKNDEVKTNLVEVEQAMRLVDEQTKKMRMGMREKLAEKAKLTEESAKEILISQLREQIMTDRETMLAQLIEEHQESAPNQAKSIAAQIMQKYNLPSSVDHRSTTIPVPKDEMKGILIGPEARNMAYLEHLVDAEIIFNDEPQTITVGGFNLIQRDIAFRSVQKLLKTRKITNQVIDAAVKEAEHATRLFMKKQAEKALKTMDIKDLPVDLVELIGRLHFRTSYGQNVLFHSIEVGMFSALIAAEIGADVQQAKLGGFLHDIGKSIDHDLPSSPGHDYLSRDIMTHFHLPEKAIWAAFVHHEAAPSKNPEDWIVRAADAMSAGRPGARQETLERYIQRIKDLEEIATSVQGVKKAFAISAGREVRVVVDPGKLGDLQLSEVAQSIAGTYQAKLNYPGKIKVNVIRRTDASDTAKDLKKTPPPLKK